MKHIWNLTTKDFVKKFHAYCRTSLRYVVYPIRYYYGIEPAQLAFLINGIESTKAQGGAVVEIGVSSGRTSVFLLEHLRASQKSPRPVVLIDTFDGFVESSIAHEDVIRPTVSHWQLA